MNYTGPVAGYTTDELAEALGSAIIEFMDSQGMQIVWKKK